MWLIVHIKYSGNKPLYECVCVDGEMWRSRLVFENEIGETVFLRLEELADHFLEKLLSTKDKPCKSECVDADVGHEDDWPF